MLIKPLEALRTCRLCGHIAVTLDELNVFVNSKRCRYGKQNICKLCFNKGRIEYRKNPSFKWNGTIFQPKVIPIKFPNVTDIQWAYWSGVVDCDGCISIGKLKRTKLRKKYPNASPAFSVFVEITNTRKKLVDEWANLFENRVTYQKDLRGQRTVYSNRYSGIKAYSILKNMLPYLKHKNERAELIIKFFEERYYGRGRRLPKEENERRENIWLQMKALIASGR